jgi:hypothetical protein
MIGTQQAIIDMFMQSLLWCMNLQDNNVSILLRIPLHKGGNSYGVWEKGWQQFYFSCFDIFKNDNFIIKLEKNSWIYTR